MRRREVITLLAGAAAGWPLAGVAQQLKVPTIGILVVGSPGSEQFWQLFQKSMRQLGYDDNRNFVRCLLRGFCCWREPGDNQIDIKPVSNVFPLDGSRTRKRSSRIGRGAGAIRLGGVATGMSIDVKMITRADELEPTFLEMGKERPDAVIVQPSLPGKRVAELALRYRIPAVSAVRGFVEDGGLISYTAAETEMYHQAALFVDKILKGAKPADLPVEQPTKYELVINLKIAKALGLSVPPALISRADELIE